MKLFLDTAHVDHIKKYAHSIDGVTTNPTNLAKEGENPTHTIEKICALLPGKDISVEVTEKKAEAVLQQARLLSQVANNVVVKIPCYEPYYWVIQQLVQEKIRVNITLVFTLVQGLCMAKLGVYYISPFVGRWNDIGMDGIPLVYQLCSMVERYNFSSQILAASLRDVMQVEHALLAGADAATVSVELFEKMTVHPLTQQGMSIFDHDWQTLNVKHFPEQ